VETAQHHRYRKHPDQRAPYHPRFGPIPLSRVRPIEPETLADWTAAWAWKLGRGDFNDELEFSVGYFR